MLVEEVDELLRECGELVRIALGDVCEEEREVGELWRFLVGLQAKEVQQRCEVLVLQHEVGFVALRIRLAVALHQSTRSCNEGDVSFEPILFQDGCNTSVLLCTRHGRRS